MYVHSIQSRLCKFNFHEGRKRKKNRYEYSGWENEGVGEDGDKGRGGEGLMVGVEEEEAVRVLKRE